MIDLINNKIKLALIIILFSISYILIFPELYLGNGNDKLLWSRFFSLGNYFIYDEVYQIYVYPIYHTTLYIHVISWIESLFGFNVYLIKFFVLSIKLVTVIFIWFLYFKKELYKTFLLVFLWASIPIIFFGEHYFEVDGHVSYFVILLFFYSYNLKNNIKNNFIKILLIILCFYLKETILVILIISLLINSLFFKKEIINNVYLISISSGLIVTSTVLYCYLLKIPINILYDWTIYRFDFLIPSIVLDESLKNTSFTQVIFDQFKSFLIASKGFLKFGYINVYILIIYFMYVYRNDFFKNKSFNFAFILFGVSAIVVFVTGSYSPRYQVAFLLPILIVIFSKLEKNKNSNLNSNEFIIISIILSVIIYFFIGNIIDVTKNILEEDTLIKSIKLFFPLFIIILILLYKKYKKEIFSFQIIEYIILINILLNFFIVKDDKSDYLNNPGTIINYDDINKINIKYKDIKKITNSIDINPYLENFEKISILKGYPSILPGISINKLKIKSDEINKYNEKNKDKCVGIYRCSYDKTGFKKLLKSNNNLLYIENEVLNNNKNKLFIEEFNFKLVDKFGSFLIYKNY